MVIWRYTERESLLQMVQNNVTSSRNWSTDTFWERQPYKNAKSFQPPPGQKQLPFGPTESEKSKIQDLTITAYVVAHELMRSIDHLTNIFKKLDTNSQLGKSNLHWTKCSNLISNFIAPSLLEDSIEDVRDSFYSLIVDESNDVSTSKYLCVCIKYFSKAKNEMNISLLGLILISSSTDDALYNYVITFLKGLNLKLEKLISLGTDSASSLCGKIHSLYTLFKEDVPQLILILCVRHFLDNANTDAAKNLPASVEFSCRELYNFFKNSAFRQLKYENMFNLLNNSSQNDKDQEKRKFKKLVKVCQTRWSSRYHSVERIQEN